MKKIINILGDITSTPVKKTDVSVLMIMDQLVGVNKGDELEININTYGGESFESVAIRGVLAASPATKIFNILGLCASAGTALFSANDNVSIARGAMVMYHKMQVKVEGDSNQLRKTARQLDKMENEILLPDLSIRSGKTVEELNSLIIEEWWLSSDEAINQLGFNDAGVAAVMNMAETRQIGVYKNYMERKKALSMNAYSIFINHKNNLK